MKNILVVDDDTSFNMMLKTFLNRFYHTDSVFKGKAGLTQIKSGGVDLLITDLRLPDIYGLDLLKEVMKLNEAPPVILMTGYADIRSAVEAMKLGAVDYVTKPINPDELLVIVESVLDEDKREVQHVSNHFYLETHSKISKNILEQVEIIAPTEMSVIITGESGTGKEYVSRLIHERSGRREHKFMAVDCGALPKDIATSELFGHVKGAFTGALKDKCGYFELAKGGTLFLDEIGNLSYDIQVQLLRAIQERKIRRLGADRDIEIDVRILTATNENLKSAIANGSFREDLYHRINVFSIEIPPLRERKEDIKFFSEHFMRQANDLLNKKVIDFEEDAYARLTKYHWPGNLRELKNVVKRAVLLAKNETVQLNNLPAEVQNYLFREEQIQPTPSVQFDIKDTIATKEKELIISALKETKYNKSKAAKMLNIDRKTLYTKLKAFDIDH